ncbi:hypothetical protein OH77DRAFT_1231080 [Trametes cingulata]|nr:hypothetical protein OH77DRAFT_1231080 [Trametes cingulata]
MGERCAGIWWDGISGGRWRDHGRRAGRVMWRKGLEGVASMRRGRAMMSPYGVFSRRCGLAEQSRGREREDAQLGRVRRADGGEGGADVEVVVPRVDVRMEGALNGTGEEEGHMGTGWDWRWSRARRGQFKCLSVVVCKNNCDGKWEENVAGIAAAQSGCLSNGRLPTAEQVGRGNAAGPSRSMQPL